MDAILKAAYIALASKYQGENFRILASAGATNVLLVTFLIPVSALLLGIGVLGEVIHVLEYVGMGCIFLGLIFIDGRALKWLNTYFGTTTNKKDTCTRVADGTFRRLG